MSTRILNAQGILSAEMPTGNLLWIDQVNGIDALAKRARMTIPFKTLAAAKAAAASGDTIFVLPGNYDEKNLLKNGVNWHFMAGAKVVYTGAASGGILDTSTNGSNGAVTSRVTGWGEFTVQNSVSDGHVIHSAVASSDLYIEAKSVVGSSAAAVKLGASAGGPMHLKVASSLTGGSSPVIRIDGGNSEGTRIEADWIYTSSGAAVIINGGGLYLRARKLAAGAQPALDMLGASSNTFVEASEIVASAYIAVRYSASSGILNIVNARLTGGGSGADGRALYIGSNIGSSLRVKLTSCVLIAAGDYSIAAVNSGTKVQLNGGAIATKERQTANVDFVGGNWVIDTNA